MASRNKPWFVPKRSGLGWTPYACQGWAVTFVLVIAAVATIGLARLLASDAKTAGIAAIVAIMVETAIASVIAILRSGPRPD
jgi:hypothetical protein